jgi:hypothetical protein
LIMRIISESVRGWHSLTSRLTRSSSIDFPRRQSRDGQSVDVNRVTVNQSMSKSWSRWRQNLKPDSKSWEIEWRSGKKTPNAHNFQELSRGYLHGRPIKSICIWATWCATYLWNQ